MMLQVVLAMLFLIIGSTTPSFAQINEWQSTHYRDHKLVGMMYLPGLKQAIDFSAKGQWVIQQQLLKDVGSARFVLLGEQHDNPDHHRLQAWLLDEMTKRGRKPSVVMEMIPQSYAAQASNYDLKTDPGLEKFAIRLDWEKRGWYSWDIYRPVGLAVARNGLQFIPGNLDRKRTRALSKTGVTALSEDERKRYRAAVQLSPEQTQELNMELKQSHCGMLPEKALPSMSLVQRVRDGVMANAMASSAKRDGSVLIAGNGHVRKDRGVPLMLKSVVPGYHNVEVERDGKTQLVRTPKSQNFVVGLIEVQPGIEDPVEYSVYSKDGVALYDVVIFTPRFDITDHCATMREHFKKLKKKQP